MYRKSGIFIAFEIPDGLLSGILIDGELQKRVFGFSPSGGGIGVGVGCTNTNGKLNLFPISSVCVGSGLDWILVWAAAGKIANM